MAKLHFTDHLDDMMERLMNEDLSGDNLKNEIDRAKALAQLTAQKINHDKNIINAVKIVSDGSASKDDLKGFLKIE